MGSSLVRALGAAPHPLTPHPSGRKGRALLLHRPPVVHVVYRQPRVAQSRPVLVLFHVAVNKRCLWRLWPSAILKDLAGSVLSVNIRTFVDRLFRAICPRYVGVSGQFVSDPVQFIERLCRIQRPGLSGLHSARCQLNRLRVASATRPAFGLFPVWFGLLAGRESALRGSAAVCEAFWRERGGRAGD